MKMLIRKIGSLKFAITLLFSLVILLIVSTSLESVYGIEYAQRTFYTAWWFDVFLSFLWLNIFCATLTRIPFKKRHVGFITTHVGILTLLIGALLSRIAGVEGQITLFEGEHWDRMKIDGYEIRIGVENDSQYVFNLLPKNYGRKRYMEIPGLKSRFEFLGLDENRIREKRFVDKNQESNHAIHLKLNSDRVGLDQTFWLVESDPNNAFSKTVQLGPALIEMQTHKPLAVQTPTLKLYDHSNKLLASVELLVPENLPILIPGTNLSITQLSYFNNAKVKNGTLVNIEEDGGFNPAIIVEIQDNFGKKEKHTKFMLFPDFESLHGKESPNHFDLSLFLEAPLPEGVDSQYKGPRLLFTLNKDNKWEFTSTRSDGTEKSGVVQMQQPTKTGWMDMTFEVLKTLSNAQPEFSSRPGVDGENGRPAVRMIVPKKNTTSSDHWIFPDSPLTFTSPEGRMSIELAPLSLPVPFDLALKDFRKVDYPGTQSAASFESDVVVRDLNTNHSLETTISMNEPLDFNGFRIFQSSYIQDPELGEASVFTVAKNPGIWLIYIGGIIILIGVLILFYSKSMSSFRPHLN